MTSQSNIELRPTDSSSRIESLDIIRGVALLGILYMNILEFGLAGAYSDPTISGGSTGLNLIVWIIGNMFFEGTMRGLFTMLFGAGFILLTSLGERKGGGIKVADLYYRRTIWLLLFGFVHVYFMLWYNDILFPYAVFGLLLFPFRNTKPKYLVIAGLVLLSVTTLKQVLDYKNDLSIKTKGVLVEQIIQTDTTAILTVKQTTSLKTWQRFKKSKKNKEQVAKVNKANLGKYLSIVKSRISTNIEMQSKRIYVRWVWDILSFMLIGIAFFKWRIFQGERSFKFYFLLMSFGYIIGLSVNYYETMLQVNSNFDLVEMSKAKQMYQLGRLFTTIGHIGLFMLFIKSGAIRFLQKALAAVGKMALTNYLMQTILCTTYFLGYGFGMFGKLQRYELYYVVFVIWVLQLFYSPLWLKYFKYGPAEWLWRSLSYKKTQPFKK